MQYRMVESLIHFFLFPKGACDADEDLARFSTDGIKVEELKTADDTSNNINKEGGKIEEQDAEEMDKKVFRCNTQFMPGEQLSSNY